MDKVTQQNAAGAEESASAAEQLSAQSHNLMGMVQELNAVVSGTRRDVNAGGVAPAKAQARAGQSQTWQQSAHSAGHASAPRSKPGPSSGGQAHAEAWDAPQGDANDGDLGDF
jgi:methyl-accepting chemotaxis protein